VVRFWRDLRVRALALTFAVLEVFSLGSHTVVVHGLHYPAALLPWHYLQGLPLLNQTLPNRFSLLADGAAASFDFAFVDADKENYGHYYERALKLLRPGGLAAFDNVLWHGSVHDETVQSPDARAIREFNAKLHVDERVWLSLVPIGDGLTLALKR